MDSAQTIVGIEPQGNDSYSQPEETSENIRILVRIRPPLYAAEPMALEAEGPQTLSAVSSDGRKSVTCSYDYVLPPQCSQGEVYKIVQQCTDSVLAGYNSTVFAYGQTGSGKTHTMFGPPGSISQTRTSDQIGIIPRAINDIFNLAQSPDVNQFSVLCSFVQLYNEQCFDMLRDGSMSSALQIREDVTGEIYVQGLSEYIVKSIGDTLLLLRTAEENRAIRETNMNQYSSRSHSIFQILVEQKKTAADGGEITLKAKFNLVDLAGSEKWNTKQDMMQEHISEMTNINLSLHTLGKCISALVKRSKQGANSNMHIPYRDSKLTRLLQDSLGGNSKTFLIATVSPASSNADESINTLKFADRAKQVMVQAKVNESRPIDHAMVQSLQNEVKNLKHLLKEVSIYIQAVVSRSPSPGKKLSGLGIQVEDDDTLTHGGAFLTNHASVAGRSGRLAFEEADGDDQNRNTENSNSSKNNDQRSEQKAALFDAIQAALGGTAGTLPRRPIQYNVASYTAPPAASAGADGRTAGPGEGKSGNRSAESSAEVARLSELVESQTKQLQALEQREMHTWHLLEAMQTTMKMFFKYEIEEDDMKKQVNKLFGNLKDVKGNKNLYSPTSKSGKESSSAAAAAPQRQPQAQEGVVLPSIGSSHSMGAHKKADGKKSAAAVAPQQEPKLRQGGVQGALPKTKSLAKPPDDISSSDDEDSSTQRKPALKSKASASSGEKAQSIASNKAPSAVAFRVRGAPSSHTDDGDSWQSFGGPTYTEEEQEAMLLEKIKQKKKKKRKEEKVAEWLRSKEERNMEILQREAEEKTAREEEERAREEKRRQRAQKQKLKLNEYYARVKSDLASIQQMNEMGISPEDVIS